MSEEPEDLERFFREELERITRKTWVDRVLWDHVLPYTDHFTIAVIVGFLLWGAWSLVHGAWVMAAWTLFLVSINALVMWWRHRNARLYRQEAMLFHAMVEIERPDPS